MRDWTGKELWVTEFSRNLLHRVQLVDPTTIAPIGTAIAYHFTGPAPDSMRSDSDGNLYVAMYGQGRVLVFNSNGIPIGQVLLPGRDEGHNLQSTNMAIRPGTNDLVIVTKVGYRHVHLDAKAQTVWFDRPGVELDPGGIGKGYAVDRMVDVLRQKGIRSALVAGSGSSIYGMGAPPQEPKGWPVAVKDPWQQSKTKVEVFLKDMSMSTSGSYEKFFRAEGKV